MTTANQTKRAPRTPQASTDEKTAKKAKGVVVDSLATKYRPRSIADLVGQDHLASQVRGMFKAGRFPNAILIAGESGTGKTTTARIIARTLNCTDLDKETLTPCGVCMNCKYGNNHPDFQEINAASTRGIDDVRALIQASKNMPILSEQRIFLLDEVHMFTPQAFNALLRPLEEPPAKTLWILATTNPEKIPSTILGRCHSFQVRPIEPTVIKRRLARIARSEGLEPKEVEGWSDIVKVITDLTNGRMRDSIQMLESVIFMLNGGREVSAQEVIKRFLTSTEAELDECAARLLLAMITRNVKAAYKEIRGSANARGVLNKTRWLISYLSDNSVGLAKYTPWSAKVFAKEAKALSGEVKINLAFLLSVQHLLLEIENKMNTISVDETVLMSALVGNFIAQSK